MRGEVLDSRSRGRTERRGRLHRPLAGNGRSVGSVTRLQQGLQSPGSRRNGFASICRSCLCHVLTSERHPHWGDASSIPGNSRMFASPAVAPTMEGIQLRDPDGHSIREGVLGGRSNWPLDDRNPIRLPRSAYETHYHRWHIVLSVRPAAGRLFANGRLPRRSQGPLPGRDAKNSERPGQLARTLVRKESGRACGETCASRR